MKNRYDGNPSKDVAIANTRQKRLEAEHSANNAFVKKQQAQTAKMGGHAPNLKKEAMHFDAYQCNNGPHAQELARDITKGLDKKAFPVK